MSFEEETAILCQNIKYLRKSASLSCSEMAVLLHISEQELAQIESGKMAGTVSTEIFVHIRRSFGITPYVMLTTRLENP